MRKLNRRVLRWQRYAARTGWVREWECYFAYKPPSGWDRALAAQHCEWSRRNPTPRGYQDSWWAEP